MLLLVSVVFLVACDRTICSEPEDFQVDGNISVTLCPNVHLCQNKGCGTSWIRNSACQCDWACVFFDDCCLDFTFLCSMMESPSDLGRLTNSQFECVSQTVQQQYSAITPDFWMVSHCPNTTSVSNSYAQIRDNCEATINTNPLTLIPVTDARKITFRSIYCALCNGRPTSELVAWKLKASCQQPPPQNTSYKVFLQTVWNTCEHFFELPSVDVSGPATRRPCLPSVITSCGTLGTENLLTACQNVTAIVKASDQSLYRNPVCFALCKESSKYSLTCSTGVNAFPTYTVKEPRNEYVGLFPSISWNVRPASYCPVGFTFIQSTMSCTPEGPPPVSLAFILDFTNPDHDSSVTCQEGDLFDPVSETCLGPTCEIGLQYEASLGRCEPIYESQPISIQNETTSVDDVKFQCLDSSYQGSGGLLVLLITLESSNLTKNDITNIQQNGDPLGDTELCIHDLLEVNLTSTPEAVSDNSSQIAFNILTEGLLKNDRTVTSNETDFEESIRQIAVDSFMAEIEEKLLNLPTADVSPCGIQTLQIVQSCGEDPRSAPEAAPCSQLQWVSFENETHVRVNNKTIWAFDSSQGVWYKLKRYNLRIQYHKHESRFVKRSLEISPCNAAPNNSCPAFVQLSDSEFSLVDENTDDFKNHANGSLIFLRTGEILDPDEFTRTGDGQLTVCKTLLPKNGTKFFNFNDAQAIFSTVGLVVSVVAGSVTLLTYVVFPSLHGRTRKAIMGMVSSLIAAQTLLLISGFAAADHKACTAAAIVGHFLWLSSITWTNVLAFLLWNTFATRNPCPSTGQVAVTSKLNLLSFAYAIGVPLAIVTACLTVHLCSSTGLLVIYNSQENCWINSGLKNLVVFGAPMALFLLINIFLFARTVWVIRVSHRRAAAQFTKGHKRPTLKRRSKELFIYIRMASLMGFTWLFGFAAAFSKVEPLWYLFIILNSLQGLFVFLSFTFNIQVKKLWMKKLTSAGGLSLTKTSFVTSRRKSKSTTTSISAGVAASESLEMSSNPTSCTSNTEDETIPKTSSRFMAAVSRVRAKSPFRSGPTFDSKTNESISQCKGDGTIPLAGSSDCPASSAYEDVIPGSRPDPTMATTNDNCKTPPEISSRFRAALSRFIAKPIFPSRTSSNSATKVMKPGSGKVICSSDGSTDVPVSSEYEEIVPGRCLESTEEKQCWPKQPLHLHNYSPQSSNKTEDFTESSNNDKHHHPTIHDIPNEDQGKSVPHEKPLPPPRPKPIAHCGSEDVQRKGERGADTKPLPKIPLLPFKSSKSKAYVLEETIECIPSHQIIQSDVQKSRGEISSQSPRGGLDNIDGKELKQKPISLIRDKPAILPRPSLGSMNEDSLTNEDSNLNPYHFTRQDINKKDEQDSEGMFHPYKPAPPPRPHAIPPGNMEARNGNEYPTVAKGNASPPKVPVLLRLRPRPKGDDLEARDNGGPYRRSPDEEKDLHGGLPQKTFISSKPDPPPRPMMHSQDAQKASGASGWDNVIGQLKGQ